MPAGPADEVAMNSPMAAAATGSIGMFVIDASAVKTRQVRSAATHRAHARRTAHPHSSGFIRLPLLRSGPVFLGRSITSILAGPAALSIDGPRRPGMAACSGGWVKALNPAAHV